MPEWLQICLKYFSYVKTAPAAALAGAMLVVWFASWQVERLENRAAKLDVLRQVTGYQFLLRDDYRCRD